MANTKCTPELVEQAEAYVDGEWEKLGHTHPSKTGLSIYLEISVRSLQKWQEAGKKTAIIRTLERIEDLAPFYLTQGGLKSELNPTITKLALSNYGVIEKNETALTGKDGGDIKTDNKWTISVVKPSDNTEKA